MTRLFKGTDYLLARLLQTRFLPGVREGYHSDGVQVVPVFFLSSA